MAWIKVVQPDEAKGELKKEYDEAMKRAGYIAQVHRILVEWPQLELVDEVTVEIKENEKTRMRGFVTDEAVGIVED